MHTPRSAALGVQLLAARVDAAQRRPLVLPTRSASLGSHSLTFRCLFSALISSFWIFLCSPPASPLPQCQYARLTLPLLLQWARAGLHNDSRARARFDSALAADLAFAARAANSNSQSQAAVEQLVFGADQRRLTAQLRYGPKCAEVADTGAAAALSVDAGPVAPAGSGDTQSQSHTHHYMRAEGGDDTGCS